MELPLNGGHAFATVADKEVVHVHATGHTSRDGVCTAVDLKAKEGDGEDAALGHPQPLVVWVVCYSGKNMATIARQLQLCLNKVHNWSVANGFKFSKSKTICMHFCHLRTLHPDPSLTMDGDPIKVVKGDEISGPGL